MESDCQGKSWLAFQPCPVAFKRLGTDVRRNLKCRFFKQKRAGISDLIPARSRCWRRCTNSCNVMVAVISLGSANRDAPPIGCQSLVISGAGNYDLFLNSSVLYACAACALPAATDLALFLTPRLTFPRLPVKSTLITTATSTACALTNEISCRLPADIKVIISTSKCAERHLDLLSSRLVCEAIHAAAALRVSLGFFVWRGNYFRS